MKARVIPNAVRDLSMGDRTDKLACVMRTGWARSLALLGMTAWFVRWFLPKPPLLDGISFRDLSIEGHGAGGKITVTEWVRSGNSGSARILRAVGGILPRTFARQDAGVACWKQALPKK
jgi:hypothetical protein